MSEPKLVSPLLDNFIMGEPISDHDGIRCCPAMENNTGNKYIVKIISVPSSPTQLEALMLTGALKSEEEARRYVEERTNALVREIECLQQLSRQEGFLAYSAYQIVPMEQSIGFEVYILSEYRRSLLRQFTKKPLSQLDAMNLGLDICSALTACRRSGYLFVNLKPSNIYITENGEFKISDFGFLNLNSLKYASIPGHYIGSYTAPEIEDAFSSPNETMDVFSLGMILYEIFNGGILPERSDDTLPAPKYADEELSQIILKACDPAPENRWQDPAQMGQMLVGYMQKNGVFDIPIVPPTEAEPTEEFIAVDCPEGETADNDEEAETDALTAEEDILAAIDSLILEEDTSDTVQNEAESADESPTEDEESAVPPIPVSAESPEGENSKPVIPEKIPYEDVTVEVNQMLCQADMLAAMEVPEPVVAPEPSEIIVPDTETELQEEEAGPELSDEAELPLPEEPTETEEADNNLEVDMALETSKKTNWIRAAVIILLFLLLVVGGFLFFKFYVIKSIDNLEIIGNKDQLTVRITSQAEESLLTVSCTDTYGKIVTVPVVNDTAEFSGLTANSDYSITVNVTGFHILTGKTSGKYFTPIETVITECNVDIGTTEGTAILKFSITGPDSNQWKFTYSTLGQQEMSAVFSGHELTLTGLKENEIYTGYLEPVDDLFITDSQPIIFTAKELIQANDLQIVSCTDGKLLAKWKAPASVSVESWTVRCYNDASYEQTVTTKNTYYEFAVPDPADCYTVEVTAAGQKASQKDRIEKNTVTVTSITADTSVAGTIELKWESASTPEKGWIVSYGINGSDKTVAVSANEKAVKIMPTVPGGKYTFTVHSADSVETLVEEITCNVPAAKDFAITIGDTEYSKNDMQFSLCTRPQTGNWTQEDASTVYTQTFSAGQAAGFVVFLSTKAEDSEETLDISFIITDENGQLVSAEASTVSWNNMWNNNYCYLNIPSIPTASGYYTVTVCFNAQIAFTCSFTVQ